jgi:hypothetical protein
MYHTASVSWVNVVGSARCHPPRQSRLRVRLEATRPGQHLLDSRGFFFILHLPVSCGLEFDQDLIRRDQFRGPGQSLAHDEPYSR